MSRFDTWADGSCVSPCGASLDDELGLLYSLAVSE